MTKPTSVCRQWHLDLTLLSLVANRRGTWAMGALGDGSLVVVPTDDAGEDPRVLKAHDGVSLEIAPDSDDHAFLSGGDDGCVYLVDPALAAPTLLAQEKNKWIDHVASSSEGHRAYSSGKTLYRLDEEGKPLVDPVALPSSIGGLSFSPSAKHLAVSHYNGVSVFWSNAPDTEGELLPWKGSHLNSFWTPDSKILLSAMQDCSLHGWKMGAALKSKESGNEMHMQGYESKITSMGFTADKKYLVTSGSAQIVCWPFFDGGPWNKAPLTLGGAEARRVCAVAPHPADPLVAAGYDDGMIVLAPFDGRMEIMIHAPVAEQGSSIKGLVWSREGDSLLAAYEDGWLKLFTMASISRFVRGQYGS
ncbi:MAG: WD40 repeat domain-containing protein [Alphaproteobacteria bacterium]|nr:WD40 repeat domain-containing protein [Alphaproteobacteria bacterium]